MGQKCIQECMSHSQCQHSMSHTLLYPYGWCRFLGFFWPLEGQREERPFLKGSTGVSCCSLEAHTATSKDLIKVLYIYLSIFHRPFLPVIKSCLRLQFLYFCVDSLIYSYKDPCCVFFKHQSSKKTLVDSKKKSSLDTLSYFTSFILLTVFFIQLSNFYIILCSDVSTINPLVGSKGRPSQSVVFPGRDCCGWASSALWWLSSTPAISLSNSFSSVLLFLLFITWLILVSGCTLTWLSAILQKALFPRFLGENFHYLCTW